MKYLFLLCLFSELVSLLHGSGKAPVPLFISLVDYITKSLLQGRTIPGNQPPNYTQTIKSGPICQFPPFLFATNHRDSFSSIPPSHPQVLLFAGERMVSSSVPFFSTPSADNLTFGEEGHSCVGHSADQP
ncbi:hypothetical protein CEXT_32171 [Caerostris extrusa]|uniref:Secreted protein n=1 Tax=Caerostris extrusa TaxID=172846 RepID=A0AAV4QZ53_CAEEX|nr:hypothetical protein CEXT_32171 [Caerostris extrusa]